MERVILHCDLNSFYASVEELYHPEVKGKPIAVAGDQQMRHGIILTKNQQAKKYGIVTGEAIWQAKQKCPDLIIFKPNYPRYLLFSKKVRKIFCEYTDLVEPFGLDEAWLDVTNSKMFGTGKEIADKLRERIKFELGLTASVGVSFNKIFAKLGSDLRKPDFTTVIERKDVESVVWPLKASEMLFVGKATEKMLNLYNMYTIGDIAKCDVNKLIEIFGKNGQGLHDCACGYENSPVKRFDEQDEIKSIGNSSTPPKDMTSFKDVEIVAIVLAESVSSRLKENRMKCREVSVSIRDNELHTITRQIVLNNSTNLCSVILEKAKFLFHKNVTFEKPIRSIGISVSKLSEDDGNEQLSLFDVKTDKELRFDNVIDDIRSRYGFESIKKLSLLQDSTLSDFNPRGENVIKPGS